VRRRMVAGMYFLWSALRCSCAAKGVVTTPYELLSRIECWDMPGLSGHELARHAVCVVGLDPTLGRMAASREFADVGFAMTTLKQSLDWVWQDKKPRLDSASAALIDMDDSALLDMIKIFLLAEAGHRLIVDDEVDQGALYLRYRGSGESTLAHIGPASARNAIVRLADIGKSLVADDGGFRMAWGSVDEYSACSILGAEQFARDHIDTLLYEPVHIRERHLEQIAANLGVSRDLLIKLAYHVRSLGPASLPTRVANNDRGK
jgi:hypothetical protein